MIYTVHSDISAPLSAAINRKAKKAETVVAAQIEKDTSPFVPFLKGSLDTRTHVEENAVVYPGPYARFLYYGTVMIDPNTGSTYAPAGGTKVETDRDLVFTKDFHPQAQAFWFEASKAQNKDKWLRVAQKAVEKFG